MLLDVILFIETMLLFHSPVYPPVTGENAI